MGIEQRVTVGTDDRARIVQSHYPVTREVLGYPEDTLSDLPVRCGLCGADWASPWGCPTRQLVVALAHTEALLAHQEREAARRIDELSTALHGRARFKQRYERTEDNLRYTFSIDRYTMVYGRLPLVDHVMRAVYAAFNEWWKEFGLKQRVAEDHLYALALDAERYNHIRQFDPSAPVTYL